MVVQVTYGDERTSSPFQSLLQRNSQELHNSELNILKPMAEALKVNHEREITATKFFRIVAYDSSKEVSIGITHPFHSRALAFHDVLVKRSLKHYVWLDICFSKGSFW